MNKKIFAIIPAVVALVITATASAHVVVGTTATPLSGTAGVTALADTAQLSQTTTDRDVLFTLRANCNDGDAVLFSSRVEVTTSGASTVTSGTFTPTTAGTYQWVAQILVDGKSDTPGDAVESSSQCGSEPVTVAAAPTAIATPTPSPTATPTPTPKAAATTAPASAPAVTVPATGGA